MAILYKVLEEEKQSKKMNFKEDVDVLKGAIKIWQLNYELICLNKRLL